MTTPATITTLTPLDVDRLIGALNAKDAMLVEDGRPAAAAAYRALREKIIAAYPDPCQMAEFELIAKAVA